MSSFVWATGRQKQLNIQHVSSQCTSTSLGLPGIFCFSVLEVWTSLWIYFIFTY